MRILGKLHDVLVELRGYFAAEDLLFCAMNQILHHIFHMKPIQYYLNIPQNIHCVIVYFKCMIFLGTIISVFLFMLSFLKSYI